MTYAVYPDGVKRRVFYDDGLPFSRMLAVNIDDLHKRVHANKPVMIIVDGFSGEGKTTLAEHIAWYYQGKKYIDKECQYAMGGDEFVDKLDKSIAKKYKVVIYDEAGDFDKRGALTKFNRELLRVFDTYRAEKILVILALPCFAVLDDPIFLKGIPRLLVHTHSRNNFYGNYDAYSLYNMFWIKHNMKKIVVTPHAYGQTIPNFRGHFLDLPPEQSSDLHQVSLAGKRKILSDMNLKRKGWISMTEMAAKMNWTKRYLRTVLQKQNIKHVAVYKRAKYYTEDNLMELRYLKREQTKQKVKQ